MKFHFLSREDYRKKEDCEILNLLQKKYGDFISGIYLYTYKIQSGNIEKVVKSSLMLQTINERFLL